MQRDIDPDEQKQISRIDTAESTIAILLSLIGSAIFVHTCSALRTFLIIYYAHRDQFTSFQQCSLMSLYKFITERSSLSNKL